MTMTADQLNQYYAYLLIAQYRNLPRASTTIIALVNMISMDLLPLTLLDAFDLDTAVGVQLDILGKYQGITRYSYGTNGPFTLDDDDFRKLIRLAIVKNTSDSSLKTINTLLYTYFNNEIQVLDNKDMTLQYIITTSSTNLFQAFQYQNLLPSPMGVGINVIVSVLDLTNNFGFGTYDSPLGYKIVHLTNYDQGGIYNGGIFEWSSTYTYSIDSVCKVSGSYYISLTNNNLNNNPVSDFVNWVIIPIWSNVVTYNLNDVVIDSSSNSIFRSLVGSNLNNPISDGNKWIELDYSSIFLTYNSNIA